MFRLTYLLTYLRDCYFRPMLLPDISALLSLKQPLSPEVTSLARRPGGSRQTSMLNGAWKRRRLHGSQELTINRNGFDCETTENGIHCYKRSACMVRSGRVGTVPDFGSRGRGFKSRPWLLSVCYAPTPTQRDRLMSSSQPPGYGAKT